MNKLIKGVPLMGEILLSNQNLSTVVRVRNALSTIKIEMNDTQIANSIINCLTNKSGYVSILPLSSKVKLSLPEVEKLERLKNDELSAINYLIDNYNKGLENLIVIKELRAHINKLGELPSDKEVEYKVDYLYDELEVLFFASFRKKPFRSGFKKLIIKAAVANLIYSRTIGNGKI